MNRYELREDFLRKTHFKTKDIDLNLDSLDRIPSLIKSYIDYLLLYQKILFEVYQNDMIEDKNIKLNFYHSDSTFEIESEYHTGEIMITHGFDHLGDYLDKCFEHDENMTVEKEVKRSETNFNNSTQKEQLKALINKVGFVLGHLDKKLDYWKEEITIKH